MQFASRWAKEFGKESAPNPLAEKGDGKGGFNPHRFMNFDDKGDKGDKGKFGGGFGAKPKGNGFGHGKDKKGSKVGKNFSKPDGGFVWE